MLGGLALAAAVLVRDACSPGVPISTGAITTPPRRFVLGTPSLPLPDEGDFPLLGSARFRVTRGEAGFGGKPASVGSLGFLPLFLGESGTTAASACSLALRLEGRPGGLRCVAASSWASTAGASAIVSSAVPVDTLRERRADRTGFAVCADDE